jgi:flagellar basal body-associated protein FliL
MRNMVEDDQARQGRQGRPVLLVLIASLFLLGAALTGYMFWSSATSPDSTSQNASRTAVTGSPTGSKNPSVHTLPQNPAYPAPSEPSATGSTSRPANQ